MHGKAKKIICLVILLSVAKISLASSGWTDYVYVAELIPTIHGRFIVKLKVSENPSTCKRKDMFYRDYGLAGSTQMFNTLLAAVESEKKVSVFVTGQCDINGYSEISSISIVP